MGKDNIYFDDLPQGYSASVEDGIVVVRKKPEVGAMHQQYSAGTDDRSSLELTVDSASESTLDSDEDTDDASGLQDIADSRDSMVSRDSSYSWQEDRRYTSTGRKKRPVWKRIMDFPDLLEAVPEEELAGLYEELERIRPQTRADCEHGQRPCIFVSCKYHLGLAINPKNGEYYITSKEGLFSMEESCALDVAARGGATLEVVGEVLNITRERVRQIEAKALEKLRKSGKFSTRRDIRDLHEDINDDYYMLGLWPHIPRSLLRGR